jgi:hypothetical protein
MPRPAPLSSAVFAVASALTLTARLSFAQTPVLQYTFETPDANSPTVFDTSGSNNNATRLGSVGYDTYRKFGQYSAGFPGVSGSYIRSSSPVSFGDQFTLFAFVATGDSQVPLLSSLDANNGLSLALSGGRLTFQAGQIRGVQSDPLAFSFGTWNSIAVTVNRTTQSINMYYNGAATPITNAYGSGNPADTFSFTPGGNVYAGSYWGIFEGGSKYLDHIQVYNSVLNAGQIAQLNSSGSLGKPAAPTPPSLPTAKLSFNFDSDTTIATNAGSTGAANNGTLVNAEISSSSGATGQRSLQLATASVPQARMSIGQYALSDVSDQGGDATLATWVNAGASPQLQMIFANANTFPYGGFKLFISPDRSVSLEIGNGAGGVAGFSTAANALLDDGKYHHVAVSIQKVGDQFSNTYARIFIDGVDVTANSVPIGSVSGPADTSVGQQDSIAEPFPLVGNLDDFRAYAGRLTPEQIAYVGAPRWANNVNGDFADAANWNGATPNGVGSIARLGDRVSAPRSVTLGQDRTVGLLIIDPAVGGSYAVAGPGTLTLDRSGGAIVQNFAGANTITAQLRLPTSTTFDISAGSSLGITNLDADADNNYSKIGDGTVGIPALVANSITVSAGTLAINSSAAPNVVSVVSSLAVLPGALLNLGNTDLIVKGGDVGAIRALVGSWYNNGAKNGPGIGAEIADYTTLAVRTSDLGNGFPEFVVFDGVNVLAADVIVKYTYLGDTDLSGLIDASDLNAVLNGMTNGLSGWANGDTNYDGVVNGVDWNNVVLAFANQGGVLGGGSPSSPGGSVPEPAAIALLTLPALGLRRRRR